MCSSSKLLDAQMFNLFDEKQILQERLVVVEKLRIEQDDCQPTEELRGYHPEVPFKTMEEKNSIELQIEWAIKSVWLTMKMRSR